MRPTPGCTGSPPSSVAPCPDQTAPHTTRCTLPLTCPLCAVHIIIYSAVVYVYSNFVQLIVLRTHVLRIHMLKADMIVKKFCKKYICTLTYIDTLILEL